jgi:hypothetical protein
VVSSVDGRVEVRSAVTSPWRSHWPLALVVLVAIGVTAAYVVVGTDFVLDDWFTLRNAHFDGALGAAGDQQRVARPGAWLVYALVFGVIGHNPVAVVLLQGAIGVATAVLLVLTLRRFVPHRYAVVVGILWVVLPNHTSLEVWASATNISLSVLLLVAGCLVLSTDRLGSKQIVGAAVLFAASVLCYEATLPCAAVAVLVLPRLASGRMRWDAVAVNAFALAATAIWIVTHWHPAKSVAREMADLSQMLGAHLGWGIAPDGVVADVLLVLGVIGVGTAFVRLALPSLRSHAGVEEWMVLGGAVVVVLGTVPFAFYLYAPLGAGDRFNAVSALGGAIVWTGVLAMVWRANRALAGAGLAVLLVVGVVARAERVQLWHEAGHDAVAILDGVRETIPAPTDTIVIGPAPIQQGNVAAFLDQSNINAAVQFTYDDETVRAGISFDQQEFDRVPPDRRFDIRPVSELHAR